MYFIKSRTKVFKQVDADIWFYCALRPLKYNNFLLRRYNIKYQARAKDKTDYQNLLVKAENRLRRIFLKKKSYFGKVLVLRRKLKLFFNFFSWNKIEKWFLSLYFKKKNDDFLSFESSLLQGIECLLFFFVFRLNYVLSFKEYAFFLQNGVFSVDGLVVRDVFFLLKVGGLLSINFNYHKSLFFRRVYVKFFGEYVRLGRFFLRGLVPYFYIFYYYKMLRSFRRERLNDLRIRSMRYFGRFKSLHIKNVVFPFEQILKINFNPSVQVFSKFSRFIKKWSIFYLYLFAYYFVFFYFYFFFFFVIK